MIRLNKDTHVNGNSSQLVDSNNHVVGTAKVANVQDLVQAPAQGAEYDYSQIESVSVTVIDSDSNLPGKLGLRSIGSFWYNSTDMDFFLETGLTLHISKGVMKLAPTLKNAFGATPAAHRRQLFLCGGLCIGYAIVGAVSVGIAAYHLYL